MSIAPLKTLKKMNAVKTRPAKKKVENIFDAGLDTANGWLFWALLIVVAIADLCTLYQIVTAN